MSRRKESEENGIAGVRGGSVRLISGTPIGVRVGDFELIEFKLYTKVGSIINPQKIEVGKGFEIHAEYKIKNYNPGTLLAAVWSTVMTIYDETHKARVGEDLFSDHWGGEWLTAHDAVNVIMPPGDTVYRVKIFANQAQTDILPALTRY